MNVTAILKSGRLIINSCLLLSILFFTNKGTAQNGLPYQTIDLSGLDEFQRTTGNWIIAGDVYMDLLEDLHIESEAGTGILVNTSAGDNPQDIYTEWEHGDLDLELEFMMAANSNSGIYFQGRYELQMLDSWGVMQPAFYDMGGIYQWWEDGVGKGGVPPRTNASRAPGLWQHLEAKFRAPRFDETGNKIQHAKLEEVRLNGVLIHSNVNLVHPTGGASDTQETSRAPLRIQGDHGPVAFRNIRYKSYHNQSVDIQNLSYRYFTGEFESAQDVSESDPAASGSLNKLNLEMLTESSEIGVIYSGNLLIEHSGDYYFDTRTDGGHKLMVAGRVLSEKDDGNRRYHQNDTTIYLEEGEHSFEFIYFRGARGGQPASGIFVEGPGINMYGLHESASLPMGRENIPLLVKPEEKPLLMHGFMAIDDSVHTHTAAVGLPGQVHFAFDQNSGALMKIWKGDFINAASMWAGRGGRNLSLNEDYAVPISSSPSLARIDGARDMWPSAHPEDSEYQFKSYRLLDDNSLAFHYSYEGANVTDIFQTDIEGKVMKRSVAFENVPNRSDKQLFIRVAAGNNIDKLPNELYEIDNKTYYIQLHGEAAGNARLRTAGSKRELLVPVSNSEHTTIEYSMIW